MFRTGCSWIDPHPLTVGPPRGRSRRMADARPALAAESVPPDFSGPILHHRADWRGNDLPQAADRSERHGARELVDQYTIGGELPLREAALRPALQQRHHFLRAHAAGNAF